MLGEKCTLDRQEFTEAAARASEKDQLDQEDDLQEVKTQAKKIRSRGSSEASASEVGGA